MTPLVRDRTVLATLACVVAAACWALNAVFAAEAFERGVSPERLAQARVVVALLPLVAWLVLVRRDLLRPPARAVPALVGFGAAMMIVNLAYYVAIDRVPVGVAIALQYTAPVLILVGTAAATRIVPPRTVWVAGGLTLLGALLVSGTLGAAGGSLDQLGLLAGIGAALTFAAYLLLAERAGRQGSHPVTTLFIGFCVAAVIWGTVLPFWDWPVDLLAEPEVAWRVLAVGLIGTLLPFALAVAALRWISSALAAIATTTEPVLAAALAWLLLGQALSVPQLVGGALVIAGVLTAQAARHPRPEDTPVELAP